MSEQQIILIEVQKKITKNNTKLKTAHQDAVLSEVRIKQCESQIEYQTKLYNDVVNKLKLEIEDAVSNAKYLHDNLEDLLKEKESLHIELKKAANYGKKQCEHCEKYFTVAGLPRHQTNCKSKPEIKVDKKHGDEVKEIKDDIEARKAALKKELAALDKKEPKKPEPVPSISEEVELLAAEEAVRITAEKLARKKAAEDIQKVVDEVIKKEE